MTALSKEWLQEISSLLFFCPIQACVFFFYRLKDVQTLEELGDVYNHFLLYYGRDIPKMQNAAKSNKKRLKKIKEVSEDGKIDVSELTISLDDDGRMLHNLPYLNYLLHDWFWCSASLGEEEELEVEQEEEQKGPDLKLASRRDMYSICQSVGLG